MKKSKLLCLLACLGAMLPFAATAQTADLGDELLYSNNFQNELTNPSTEMTIYGQEFTLSWVDCTLKTTYVAKNDNGVTTPGALEMSKSPTTATIQFGELPSVTRVVVKGSTTGNNRGYGFYYSTNGGVTWTLEAERLITGSGQSDTIVLPEGSRENVTFKLMLPVGNSNYFYLHDIEIYGVVNTMSEESLYTNNFQTDITNPSTETTIYGEEFTLSWVDCTLKTSYVAKNDNGVTSPGALEMSKSPTTATIQFGQLASVTKVVIKGSTTGNNRGYGFYYSNDGGTTWTLEAEHLITGAGQSDTILLPEGCQENVTFKLMLPVGNANYFYLHDIEIFGMVSSGNTIPAIIGVEPATGTVIPVEGTLTLNFSCDVTRGTGDITLGNVVIAEGDITCNGTSATLAYSGLSTDTEYRLTVPAGAFVNEKGEATLAVTTADYTTPDTKAPILSDATIVEGATYATSTTFSLVFNEQVMAGNVPMTINDIEVTPGVSTSQNYLMYVTVSGLAYATDYTLTIPEGAIVDASGNSFAGATYNFVSEGNFAGDVLYQYVANSTDFPETASGNITVTVNGYDITFGNVANARDRGSNGWGFKTDYVELPSSAIGAFNFKIQCGGGSEPHKYYVQKQAADGTWTTLESVIIGNNDIISFSSAAAQSSDATKVRLTMDDVNFWFYNLTVNDFFDNAAAADDGLAPSLASSTPANNATDVATSGSIKLVFSKPVKVASGKFILNGRELTPNVLSNVVTLPYANLKYETQYSLEVQAGAVVDYYERTNEAFSVTFTTKNRPTVTAALYDFVVAADGSGDGTTIQSAFNAVPDNNATTFRIFVKDGVYNEYPSLAATKENVSLIGQSLEGVVINGSRYSGLTEGGTTYGTSTCQTMEILADNFYCENMTISNTAGMNIGQAVALKVYADKAVFKNVRLTGYQDTHLTSNVGSDRQYYLDCDIRGTVDFIFGNGACYFESCLLYIEDRAGNVITAPSTAIDNTYGYVFESCTIDGVSSRNNDFYLGRPWQNAPRVVYLNTQMNLTPTAVGWTTMSALPALFAEYNSMDRNGNPVSTDSRRTDFSFTRDGVTTTDTVANRTPVLSDAEAALYTRENVLRGNDEWDATTKVGAPAAPENINYNKETKLLTWSACEATACYVVVADGVVVGFSTTNELEYDVMDAEKVEFEVMASSEYGALSQATLMVWQASGVSTMKTSNKLIVNTKVDNTLYLSDTAAAVNVYDLNGRLVAGVKNVHSLDMSRLNAGCYIVQAMKADGTVEVARVVKF